jgi:CDP-diacylglycerol--glycerol-3-phosphate 3-phosphatidyltransferase
VWPIADLISISRLVIAPVVPVVAISGYTRMTTALILCGLVSDAIDGTVARLSGPPGERGARLDSACDLAFYSMAIVAFVIAFPIARTELLGTFIITGASLLLPSVVGWLKFATIPSYHTILSRFVLVAFGIALLAFLLGGFMSLFRVAAALAVVAAIDDLVITMLLDKPASPIPHSLYLLRDGARTDPTLYHDETHPLPHGRRDILHRHHTGFRPVADWRRVRRRAREQLG